MSPGDVVRLLPLRPLPPETAPVEDSVGRILAENIPAPNDEPPHPMSEKDGFAVKFDDIPGPFRIVDETGPGERSRMQVGPGECVRVFTGSYLPEGADTVVPNEFVDVEGDMVHVKRDVKRGDNVSPQGSDFSKGQLLVPKNTYITPQVAALLRLSGIKTVKVAPRPSLGVLSIGTELSSGLIKTVNSFTLVALAGAFGLSAKELGTVPDDVNEISEKVRSSIYRFDMLVTTGGSSIGKRDLTHEALRNTGAKPVFKGLNIRPGRTTSAYTLQGKPIFLLAGVFQAALAGFFETVIPYALALMGLPPELPSIKAELLEDVKGKNTKLVWARLTPDARVIPLKSAPLRKSHLMEANCFFLANGELKKGERIRVYLPPGLFSSFTLIEWAEHEMQGS